MESTGNSLVFVLSFLSLAGGALALAVLLVFRKVDSLMATQTELKNALDVTDTDLDAIKAIVAKLVAAGGGKNVMTQGELDAFVAQAQAIRTKADAVVQAIKPFDPAPPA